MNDDTFFRILAAALIVAGALIRLYYQKYARLLGGPIQPRPEPALFWLGLGLLSLVMLAPVIAFMIDPAWAVWGRLTVPRWLRWTGAAIASSSIPLIIWVFHHLGANLTRTAGLRTNARLIDTGPYRWVRHPLYSVAAGAWFGFGLMIESGLVLASVIPFVALIALRIRNEESSLLERFGDEYRQYQQRTGRLIPRLT